MTRRCLPPLAVLLCISPVTISAARAQDVARSGAVEQTRRGAWQIGAFVGGARNSPNDGVLGTIPHRDHFMIGVQAGTPVLRLGPVRVSYIAQLLPLFIRIDTIPTTRKHTIVMKQYFIFRTAFTAVCENTFFCSVYLRSLNA